MAFLKFPEGFLWGAATSAHQTEGNNSNSDWWEWEREYAGKPGGPLEKSGIACDSYNRFEEDFDIAKKLNLNAFRLSIEWARIEPEEGVFDEKEVEHYRRVLKALKDRKLTTFVTLWHFSLPKWVRGKMGFGNLKAPFYFARYSKFVAERLGDQIDYFSTLNEPVVYVTLRHLVKVWIPQKSSGMLDFLDSWVGLLRCHFASYEAVKSVNPDFKVGFVEHAMAVEPRIDTLWNRFVCEVRKILQFKLFMFLATRRADFLGVNYYFHDVVDRFEFFPDGAFAKGSEGVEVSDWGWEIYPKGIYQVAKETARFGRPVFITENGVADAADRKRESFIVQHLFWLQKAISEGADVRGYFHWTLLDNFEWAEGYKRKFGLVEIDRENNLERKIRGSAHTYGKISLENGISEELLRAFGL